MKASRWAIAVATLQIMSPSWASAQAISQSEAEELRAQIATLKAQVQMLESRLDTAAPAAAAGSPAPAALAAASKPAPAAKPATDISWKGSPQFAGGDALFKVKGRIQYDAGVLMAPDGISDRAKGYSNELRRLRLGAEGQLGAGFGYKLETELSDNSIDLVDTFITYANGKWLVTLGNHNQFQSLDELIGDTTGSVMERAAFTDAFNFERRIGLSAQYRSGMLLAQLGLFSDSADSLTNDEDGDENNSFSVDGRVVLAPKLGKTQLHFGGSAHWRKLNRLADEPLRYRQRPYLHTVNSRFLDTRSIDATAESHYGLEFAGTRGPLYWAGETHWLRVKRPGLADPTFFGGYAEVGYFLTGETRSYKNGIFGGAKPKQAVGDGGMGALQFTVRYDYLDMNDRDIVGGTQKAWIAGLVWTPIEYLRFNVNYANLRYTDAAILAGTDRDYSVDVIGWRAELDF